MDLNPLFTDISSFRPAGDGGELKLFEHAGIQLVHGWLPDPSTPEYQVLTRVGDYDNAVNLIVEADHLAKGQLVVSEDGPSSSNPDPSQSNNLTPEDHQKIEDGKCGMTISAASELSLC